MEDNPLKAKKRAQTGPETELPIEMQMMEDQFLVYDYTKVQRSHVPIKQISSSGTESLLHLDPKEELRQGGEGGDGGDGGDGECNDSKVSLSCTTLEGALTTRDSSEQIENIQKDTAADTSISSVKAHHQPESTSGTIKQERLKEEENNDHDHTDISLIYSSKMLQRTHSKESTDRIQKRGASAQDEQQQQHQNHEENNKIDLRTI
ncbi:hypothetical protein BX616_002600 [Lobosporangium transversale]|nr:hypothetical protein BX616_002600 [Lobosporangium transversale]